MQKILETLLVEMVDALFLLYTCRCPAWLTLADKQNAAKQLFNLNPKQREGSQMASTLADGAEVHDARC